MYKVLLLSVVFLNVHCYRDNTCKVPNGDAGSCVNITTCRPLWEIYNKKRKTQTEDTYIRQSFCGHRFSTTLYVCCPSIETWHKFEANPVPFHNPLNDLGENTYYPFTQANDAKEPNVDKPTDIPFVNPTQPEVSPATPLSQTTETKVIAAVPLVRDFDNETESISNNEDSAYESLSITNRNNKQTCGDDDAYGNNRITGGDATGIDEYPWLVLLEYNSGKLGCGGSLISPRFVLTAAHCANSRVNGIPALARLSEYNTTSYPTDLVEVDGGGFDKITVTVIQVENVWPHPNYKHIPFLTDASTPNSDDIGLVKLAKDVEFKEYIDIICLPQKDFTTEFPEGEYLSVAGWGDDRLKPEESDIKKAVTIPYVPLDKCRNIHDRGLVDSQICAGGEKDKDSCIGDSGGPLMYTVNKKFYLVGIVSYGSAYCGTVGQPGVYTNVYKYLNWISDTINKN